MMEPGFQIGISVLQTGLLGAIFWRLGGLRAGLDALRERVVRLEAWMDRHNTGEGAP
jgi:hypothetical protein